MLVRYVTKKGWKKMKTGRTLLRQVCCLLMVAILLLPLIPMQTSAASNVLPIDVFSGDGNGNVVNNSYFGIPVLQGDEVLVFTSPKLYGTGPDYGIFHDDKAIMMEYWGSGYGCSIYSLDPADCPFPYYEGLYKAKLGVTYELRYYRSTDNGYTLSSTSITFTDATEKDNGYLMEYQVEGDVSYIPVGVVCDGNGAVAFLTHGGEIYSVELSDSNGGGNNPTQAPTQPDDPSPNQPTRGGNTPTNAPTDAPTEAPDEPTDNTEDDNNDDTDSTDETKDDDEDDEDDEDSKLPLILGGAGVILVAAIVIFFIMRGRNNNGGGNGGYTPDPPYNPEPPQPPYNPEPPQPFNPPEPFQPYNPEPPVFPPYDGGDRTRPVDNNKTRPGGGHSSTGLYLVGLEGPLMGQEYPISNGVTFVGRAVEANVRYPADTKGVSRKHLQIFWNNGILMIMDQGSTSGTYLRSRGKLEPNVPVALAEGDKIYLGSKKIQMIVKAK